MHTQGKWFTKAYEDERFVEIKANDGYSLVATVHWNGGDRDANAALIQTAPELLELLQSAHAQMAMVSDCIEHGRYAEASVHADTGYLRRQAALTAAQGGKSDG